MTWHWGATKDTRKTGVLRSRKRSSPELRVYCLGENQIEIRKANTEFHKYVRS